MIIRFTVSFQSETNHANFEREVKGAGDWIPLINSEFNSRSLVCFPSSIKRPLQFGPFQLSCLRCHIPPSLYLHKPFLCLWGILCLLICLGSSDFDKITSTGSFFCLTSSFLFYSPVCIALLYKLSSLFIFYFYTIWAQKLQNK